MFALIFHRTPEEWYERLKTKGVRELRATLLSERPLREKTRIILAIPCGAIKRNVWVRELENRLEDAGYTRLAQILRWRLFGNQDIT